MNWVKLIAFALLFTGSMLDHATTNYGLSLPNSQEMNPHAAMIMQWGLWDMTDYFIIVMAIGFIRLAEWKLPRTLATSTLVYPATLGLLRLVAGIHNLLVIP